MFSAVVSIAVDISSRIIGGTSSSGLSPSMVNTFLRKLSACSDTLFLLFSFIFTIDSWTPRFRSLILFAFSFESINDSMVWCIILSNGVVWI